MKNLDLKLIKLYLNIILAEIQVIFVDTFERLKNITKNIEDCPHLRLIVHFNRLNSVQSNEIKNENTKNVEIIHFNDLLVYYLNLILYLKRNHLYSMNFR